MKGLVELTLEDINKKYISMQKKYGDVELDAVLNGGCTNNPDICFIFMNPTKRNISSSKDWKGPKYPWIGTKQVWNFFNKINIIDNDLNREIQSKNPNEWDIEFAEKVYDHLIENRVYITNLGKCTQSDAKPLKDKVFKEYVTLLNEEIFLINPKKIICFGGQVTSLFLEKKIKMSEVRKIKINKAIHNKLFPVFPVYYPVGNGSFNIDKVFKDIPFILEDYYDKKNN